MASEGASPEASPTRRKARCLFVVARDQVDLWQHLRRQFGDEGEIHVMLDRRHGERRLGAGLRALDRRRGERRRTSPDRDLRYRSFLIIHEG
jgi:hypothetical protein